jgi:hypothetical protein
MASAAEIALTSAREALHLADALQLALSEGDQLQPALSEGDQTDEIGAIGHSCETSEDGPRRLQGIPREHDDPLELVRSQAR